MCYTQHKVCSARAPCNQPTDEPTNTPLRTHNNDRRTGGARGAALRLITDHGQTQCACCPDTQGARQREPSLTSTQPSRSSRPGWPWSVRWPRFAGRQDVKNAGSKRHTRQVPVWLQAVGGGGRASRVSGGREREKDRAARQDLRTLRCLIRTPPVFVFGLFSSSAAAALMSRPRGLLSHRRVESFSSPPPPPAASSSFSSYFRAPSRYILCKVSARGEACVRAYVCALLRGFAD